MESLQTFFRNVESADFWRRLAPWLHVSDREHTGTASAGLPRPPDPGERWADDWRASGYVELATVLDPASTAALARAVTTLHAHHVHPTFLYVYDETWRVLDALRPWLSWLLGDDFEVLADVWAWHIDPQTDRGGWPIHRGWYEDVRDATGSPCLANVWVALSDTAEQNACMHVVPLTRDPHYPGDLRNLTGLDGLAVALPIDAGGALVWNANAAHWGGTCDSSLHQPRISMSFTVRRGEGVARDLRSILQHPLPFRARLDLISEQFETYGDKELAPESNEMRWAKGVLGMNEAARRSAHLQNG